MKLNKKTNKEHFQFESNTIKSKIHGDIVNLKKFYQGMMMKIFYIEFNSMFSVFYHKI